jgi:hypothetical protein
MKVVRRLAVLSAVIAAVLFAVSCSKGTANVKLASKDNMIPDNSVFAVKTMPDQLWEKIIGNDDSDVCRMWKMIKLYLPIQINKYGEFGYVLKSAMEDPSSLGVNLDAPFYFSFSAGKDVCLVVLLNDSKAFLKAADALAGYLEDDYWLDVDKSRNGSYTHYQVFVKETAVDLGVTGESAVLRFTGYGNSGAPKELKASMSKLFAKGTNAGKEGLDLMDARSAHILDKIINAFAEQMNFE